MVIFSLCSKKEVEPEVLEVVNISNTPGRSENPAIACDSRGCFYVVWQDPAPNGIMAVYITQRTPAGNWTIPNYISNDNTQRPMAWPDIAIDKENTIHIVGQYTNPQGWYEVFYTKKPLGSNWSELEIIGMYGRAGVPKIAVDDYGNVHIIWEELVGYFPIFYTKRAKDGSWSAPVEISKGGVYYIDDPKIRIDKAGYAHVLWSEVRTESGPQALVYTNNVGGSWVTPIDLCLDSLSRIYGYQLAITDDGTIYVVWSLKGDIFYTFKSLSSNWFLPARICSTEVNTLFPALDAVNNELHLFWPEGFNLDTLYYFKKEGRNKWQAVNKFRSSLATGEIKADAIDVGPTTIGIVFGTGQPPDWDNEEIYFCEIPRE